MNEIYEAIEQKIKDSGYPCEINGEAIYNDICDEIEEKEDGTYLLLSKQQNDDVFEYQVTIMEDNFNLSILTITHGDETYRIDFDK
ncbi:MAG: hypothetical protein IAC13_10380 [Firmicutes bacterium]|uniref:Uncharacterized protein n=1 Tax=Candidatus Scybalomonas excrementavium TaxID=2840943 RepID=A0A9D9I1M3_9FIRM|nr:hypothetical protein [Candidatus Scybalomonas excrementavium]